MIAIIINDPGLETATSKNHTGEWYFAIARVKNKKLLHEEIFTVAGSWKDARPKAEIQAEAWSWKNDLDVVLQLTKFTAEATT